MQRVLARSCKVPAAVTQVHIPDPQIPRMHGHAQIVYHTHMSIEPEVVRATIVVVISKATSCDIAKVNLQQLWQEHATVSF